MKHQPIDRTERILSQRWKTTEVNSLLNGVSSGLRTLKLIEAHGIAVFQAKNARIVWTHLETGEKSESYLYGWTHASEGSPVVYINSRMDSFTAAATIVHEIEHAQWYFSGIGGYEEHARVADLQFYVEHGQLDLLPEEYFITPPEGKPVIYSTEKGLEVDWLEAVTRWGRTSSYGGSSSGTPVWSGDYVNDGLSRVRLKRKV